MNQKIIEQRKPYRPSKQTPDRKFYKWQNKTFVYCWGQRQVIVRDRDSELVCIKNDELLHTMVRFSWVPAVRDETGLPSVINRYDSKTDTWTVEIRTEQELQQLLKSYALR